MKITSHSRGTAAIPESQSTISPSSRASLDSAVATLQANKEAWASLDISERIRILEILLRDFSAIAGQWVAAGLRAKSIDPDSPAAFEEWMAGPFCIHRNLRLLRQSLEDIQQYGTPRIPGPVTQRANGQVSAQVVPVDTYDRLFYSGFSAEVWMEPEVTLEQLPATQALAYRGGASRGKVALVLGAGNISSIAPMDALYKLFVENQVVLLKMNPVNAYFGPLLEKGFRALIDRGFFRVTYGGAQEGAYLCKHAGVDEIHITGSDKTHDAIVFGPGPEGARRKAERQPVLTKRITSELGNVSPVIVVPGPWSPADIKFQAANLVSMLTINAGFNCNATRVIIQHAGWGKREELLFAVRALFTRVPPRQAYYPGAEERYDTFLSSHPEAYEIGRRSNGTLPWMLIAGIDANNREDICFTTEAFCSACAETTLQAGSVAEYLDRAVEFANQTLWGTLNATIIVHPHSLRDAATAAAVERAIENLRYGTVVLNHWAAVGYTFVITPWGAFPGHDMYDIQSGIGVVHNTLMFSRPHKTVIRGPFHVRPVPLWFVTNKKPLDLARKVVGFEAAPSPWKVPGIIWSALRG